MNFRESLSLPSSCSLRKDFPDGEVFVQMSGVEGHTGPAHVNLYDSPWEETPRAPVMHVKVPLGTMAEQHIGTALRIEHDDMLSEGDCGCIALDSLSATIRRHHELQIRDQQ
jgi:hypothetical protein